MFYGSLGSPIHGPWQCSLCVHCQRDQVRLNLEFSTHWVLSSVECEFVTHWVPNWEDIWHFTLFLAHKMTRVFCQWL